VENPSEVKWLRIRIIPTKTPAGLKYDLEVNGEKVHSNLDETWVLCNIRPKKGGLKLAHA